MLIDFLTADFASTILVTLVFGFIGMVLLFCAEVRDVYHRVRLFCNKETRHLLTWKTYAWLPVRLYVLIVIPQMVVIFLTSLKFA